MTLPVMQRSPLSTIVSARNGLSPPHFGQQSFKTGLMEPVGATVASLIRESDASTGLVVARGLS